MIRTALAATLVAALSLTSGCGESNRCKELKRTAEDWQERTGDSPKAWEAAIEYVEHCENIYD